MESHAFLDPARRSANRSLILLLLLLVLPSFAAAQSHDASASSVSITEVKKLYEQQNWDAVLRAVPAQSQGPAELLLYRGLALARLERWREARAAFSEGRALAPNDPRFPEELAGIAYRQKDFSNAKGELRRALALHPADAYANDFLASIYFQEGNLEAALKYWNRAGKPILSRLTMDPTPAIHPLILDRAFTFSPGEIWTRESFLATQARLQALDLYPGMYFALQPHDDNSFDLAVHASERQTLPTNRWEVLLSFFRELPYQAIHPEFYDLDHAGLTWTSTYRWDDQKRLVSSELTAPLFANPAIRYRLYFDGRNENWNLTNSFLPSSPAFSRLNLQKAAAGAELRFLQGGFWQWTAGVEYSYRDFRNLYGLAPQAAPFFSSGSSIALRSSLQRWLIRFPERRFTLQASANGELGTFYRDPLGRYARAEGTLAARWLPKARGDDYDTQISLHSGGTSGYVPFDELFTLGFDRDTPLWLRGHPGLQDGQKGNAPLGRDYVLVNAETSKVLYRNGFFTVKAGPFLDTGDVYDPSGYFGSTHWLWDTGLQTKISVLNRFQIVLGYGKDLRTGRNSFFTTVLP